MYKAYTIIITLTITTSIVYTIITTTISIAYISITTPWLRLLTSFSTMNSRSSSERDAMLVSASKISNLCDEGKS